MNPQQKKKIRIGLVDTTFARVDMGAIAIDEFNKNYKNHNDYKNFEIIRRTVPGIKDIAVECKRLLEQENCDVCLALGMVGGATIDLQCSHEASLGIQQVKLMTNKHVIEVFIHENEAWSEAELLDIFDQRIRKHVHNTAILAANNYNSLTKLAGKGIRQGKEDEGSLKTDKDKAIGIGIVVSEFNSKITNKMEEEAKKKVLELNANLVEIIRVPGAFDMILAVKKLLMNKQIDCVAVLGAVVKGETKHDEVIVFNIANKILELQLEFNKPITLGVIGPSVNWEQAEERADGYASHSTKSAIMLARRLRR